MIEYIEGDIFNSPAQVIVNTVNTVGVMGKGLALSFKKRYVKMFEAYRNACEKHLLTIGKLMLYYEPDHWILMFPTKENWRNPSKVEYIERGLDKFVRTYADKGITSIAFPKLGCGNGELSWDVVRPVMERYLKPLPLTIYIYIGYGVLSEPEHKKQEETIDWLRSNARDMSFDGLCDDIIHGQAISPYQLSCEEGKYSVKWNDGLSFDSTQQGKSIYLLKDELAILWDTMRKNGVVVTEGCEINALLFYRLIEKLGYLSPVRILDDQDLSMKRGYQANEGYGRIFALRGEML